MGSNNSQEVVEMGFARFKSDGSIVVDEPLALLALQHYFKTRTVWKPDHFARHGLKDSCAQKRGDAFELFCAYHLATAFESPKPLSEIFHFLDNNDLQNMTAQLVSVHKQGDTFTFRPVNMFSDKRPSYILGCTTSTEEQTLLQFKDPQRISFCFPAKTFGPDLILFLKLSDDTLLRVLCQFRHRTTPTIGPNGTTKGFRTIEPCNFISESRLTQAATSPLGPTS